MAKPLTSKQRAADLANLAKARAALRTKPRTPAQVAASAKNLTLSRTRVRSTKSVASAAARRHVSSAGMSRYGGVLGRAPIGGRHVTDTLTVSFAHRKPTGINKKFQKRISSTIYDQRGKWEASRVHHFKKRLRQRKPRRSHLKHWRTRRRSIGPK